MKLNNLFWLMTTAMAEGGEGGEGGSGGEAGGGTGMGAGGAGDAGGGVGSGAAGDWRASLPEGVRDWQEVKDSPDAETFYKQVGDMRSRLGRSVTIPGEDAGTEQRQAFYEKLQKQVPDLMKVPDYSNDEDAMRVLRQMGAPEDVSGYERVQVDGIDIPDERWAVLTTAAKEAGLTKKQFKSVIERVASEEQTESIQDKQRFNDEMAALNLEWGLTKEPKVAAIKNLLSRTGAPEGLLNSVQNGAAGAQTLRWLNSVLDGLGGERGQFYQQQGPGGDFMTPEVAEEAIQEIRGNSEHPYHNKLDPGHKRAREKMRALYKMAYPGEQQTG